MKLANPLYYPLPVLVGAVVLVVGVRVLRQPSVVVVPAAIAVATAGAALRKGQEPDSLGLEDPRLENTLQSVRQQAVTIAEKSEALRAEATRLLSQAEQLDLLSAVQFACDRAEELPAKIDGLAQRMRGGRSLLSIEDLQRQRQEAEQQAHQQQRGGARAVAQASQHPEPKYSAGPRRSRCPSGSGGESIDADARGCRGAPKAAE